MREFWPLSILIPPQKSRILYLTSQADQEKWFQMLHEVVEEVPRSCDTYKILKTIGAGQFGEIKLACIREDKILLPNSMQTAKPRKYVAIKRVKKANMKPVEIL